MIILRLGKEYTREWLLKQTVSHNTIIVIKKLPPEIEKFRVIGIAINGKFIAVCWVIKIVTTLAEYHRIITKWVTTFKPINIRFPPGKTYTNEYVVLKKVQDMTYIKLGLHGDCYRTLTSRATIIKNWPKKVNTEISVDNPECQTDQN